MSNNLTVESAEQDKTLSKVILNLIVTKGK